MTDITLLHEPIEKLRRKLLDLTSRNGLINFRETKSSTVRIVDELPDETFRLLVAESTCMKLLPYEPIEGTSDLLDEVILAKYPPEQSGLDKRTALNIIGNVRKLGSLEACRKVYPDQNSEVRRFAYQVMETVLGEGSLIVSDVVIDDVLPVAGEEIADKHVDDALQTPFPSKQLTRRCTNILRTTKRSLEETGVNILHLAMGFLDWCDPASGKSGKAPLILVPLEISKHTTRGKGFLFQVKHSEEDIENNLSLEEFMRQQFGLEIPKFDYENEKPEQYFDKVAEAIAFHENWNVSREMIVGFFSFSKLRLYRDLDPTIWPDNSLLTNATVQSLIIGKENSDGRVPFGEDANLDDAPEAQTLPMVLPADSSQKLAVLNIIESGRDTVIHGPPGTGKSQTITNIIAAALNAGKKILFVAEKKAALDVVRSRMDEIGLGPFCLELHSHKARKVRVHEDITRRLKKNWDPVASLNETRSAMERERDKLRSYYSFLNTHMGKASFTVNEILWGTQRWRNEVGDVQVEYRPDQPFDLSRADLEGNANRVRDFASVLVSLSAKSLGAWAGYIPEGITSDDVARLRGLLDELVSKGNQATSLWSSAKCMNDLISTIADFSKTNLIVISKLPSEFDQNFAEFISDSHAFSCARIHIDLIRRYQNIIHSLKTLEIEINFDDIENIRKLHTSMNDLYELGIDGATIDSLPQKLKKISQVLDGISLVNKISANLDKFIGYTPKRTEDVQLCLGIKDKLENAPESLSLYAYPKHALKIAANKYESIKGTCAKIQECIEPLGHIIALERLPENTRDIREWATMLDGASFFSRLFSSSVRRATRQVRDVLTPGDLSVREAPPRLLELADLLDQRKQIDSNENLSALLGPRFKGVDSNWEELGAIIMWSQRLAEAFGSEAKAASFLEDFLGNKEQFLRVTGDFQQALHTLHGHLESMPGTVKDAPDYERMHQAVLDLQGRLLSVIDNLSSIKIAGRLSVGDALTALADAIEASNIKLRIDSDTSSAKVLGRFKIPLETDISQYESHLDWRDALLGQSLCPETITWLLETESRERVNTLSSMHRAAHDFVSQLHEVFHFFDSYGTFDTATWLGKGLSDAGLEDVVCKAREAASCCDDLVAYGDYMGLRSILAGEDMQPLTDIIVGQRMVPDLAEACYRYAFFSAASAAVFQEHPQHVEMQGVLFENCRERLRTLDNKMQKLERLHVAAGTSKRPIPQGTTGARVSDYTELALVKREIVKKKRHIPIRQLVARAGNALVALKPCFMMSPMSVAQFLPPRHLDFDLIVMDEASQLRVEDALGAVARGKQTIVVGDPKQLPPTNFFKRFGGDDDEEEDTIDMESVLELAVPIFHNTTLRWHYRSIHESLIEFSSSQFYDDDLIFFPSARPKEPGMGVFCHLIKDGVFKGRKNMREAWAVAQAAQKHYHETPDRSLGIATFNIQQRDLILDYIDKLKDEDPILEHCLNENDDSHHSLFVKNLENVQGDERDVIIISTTYGPESENGRVMQRFGPLNSDVGWRRLNVIITRAKYCLHVFTSMRSQDIIVGTQSSRGVTAFRDYLEYLETGRMTERGIQTGRPPDSDFEVAVASALQRHGYTTVYQVGVAGFFIDIGVLDRSTQSCYLLGIECDGATYHSAKSVRDRDILRQEVLESRGWDIHRIWSTDWFKSPERELKRVIERLQLLEEKAAPAKAYERHEVPPVADDIPIPENRFPATREMVVSQAEVLEGVSDPPRMDDLKQALLEFREKKMQQIDKDIQTSLLSDRMVDLLCSYQPTDRNEFLIRVPLSEREKITWGLREFGDEMFELLQDFS